MGTRVRQFGGGVSEVAAVFLRLGATAFGGPAAHIAMMEDEVVRRRQWLTPDEFLDLVGATNLIPGPNSTELAIHIGHRRAGWAGLLVAGGCFILPSTLIITAIAWAYVRFGQLPNAEGLLYGVKPVIVANGDPQTSSDHAAEGIVRPSLPRPPDPPSTPASSAQRASTASSRCRASRTVW